LLSYSAGYKRLYLCRFSEQPENIDWWLGKEEPRLRK